MPLNKPGATSTPTSVPFVSGRKPIRDTSSIQSPIDLETAGHQYETRYTTETIERTYETYISEGSPRGEPRSSPDHANRNESDESESDQDDEGPSPKVSHFESKVPEEKSETQIFAWTDSKRSPIGSRRHFPPQDNRIGPFGSSSVQYAEGLIAGSALFGPNVPPEENCQTQSFERTDSKRSPIGSRRHLPPQDNRIGPFESSVQYGEGSIPESALFGSNVQSEKKRQTQFSGRTESDGSPNDAVGFISESGAIFEAKEQPEKEHRIQLIKLAGAGLVVAVVLALGNFYFTQGSQPETPENFNMNQEFNLLETEFSNQELDFWRNIRVSIQEISVLDQPRTIMFLYNSKAGNTLNKILNKVSNIAACSLTACSMKPVIIEGSSLNTSEIVNDYGKIITAYRDSLERNGVMIVKNLEKVPGVSAQAFHSFCDDYNPVVKNALILFTMEVEKLPEGYAPRFVEDFLLKLWNDIGRDDKFYPLFTRITGTILPVRPE